MLWLHFVLVADLYWRRQRGAVQCTVLLALLSEAFNFYCPGLLLD